MNQNIILSLILLAGSATYLQAQTSAQDAYSSSADHVYSQSPFYPSAEPNAQAFQVAGLPFINQSDSQFSQPATTGPAFSQDTNNESLAEGVEFTQPVTEGPEHVDKTRGQPQFENPGLNGPNFDQPRVNNSNAERRIDGPPHVIETPVHHPSARTSEPQNVISDNPDFDQPSINSPARDEPHFTSPPAE